MRVLGYVLQSFRGSWEHNTGILSGIIDHILRRVAIRIWGREKLGKRKNLRVNSVVAGSDPDVVNAGDFADVVDMCCVVAKWNFSRFVSIARFNAVE